jgi:hypothetical protein
VCVCVCVLAGFQSTSFVFGPAPALQRQLRRFSRMDDAQVLLNEGIIYALSLKCEPRVSGE